MKQLQNQIAKTQAKLNDLRKKQRLEQSSQRKPAKTQKKRGRPITSEKILIRAVQLAENKPLADVALTLNIAISTLYRHGIKRHVLEGKNGC